MNDTAKVDSGKSFLSSAHATGRWAAEQMINAAMSGQPLNANVLRTAAVLRRDQWIHFDEQINMAAQMRLAAVADLVAMGLTRPLPNALGRTVLEYERVGEMEEANVSLDAMTRGENELLEFAPHQLPLPITHKDFFFNIRLLAASRERGEALDVTHVRWAGQRVAEKIESMLVNGSTRQFGGLPLYGYTTHPDRNTFSFGTGGAWTGSKTGEQILSDVLTAITRLQADKHWGPYVVYNAADADTKLSEDFKANSDKTIRQRLLEVNNVRAIRTLDSLAAGNVVVVSMTDDVVVMIDGERFQTVMWDVHGGMGVNFKAFALQVPLVRNGIEGRSGIAHMTV